MAVYITGDTHGGMDMHKLSAKVLRKDGIVFTERDTLIVLGDFGFPFLDKEIDEKKGEYTYWMKWLANKPCTIAWLDGNHDNHPFWKEQPTIEWNGGRVQVHPKAKNVIHLLRGEVYLIEDEKYFTFGGAMSHDKETRIEGYDWWAEEEATSADILNAEANLVKHNFDVDYILTHTPPAYLIEGILGEKRECKTAQYLNSIVERTDYRMIASGHIHQDIIIPEERFVALYNSAHSIKELEQRIENILRQTKKEKERSLREEGFIL